MYQSSRQRLMRLLNSGAANMLGTGLIGIERETLRVTPAGHIAQTPHPLALGAPLTHPYITTDYSEALLEFITPPQQEQSAVIQSLVDTHRFVYKHLEGEYLWPASMPGVLAGDESIPIATYGCSNAGLMKTIYRRGIGLRYGRVMQTIAGVHFNYSLPKAYWPIFKDLEGSRLNLPAFASESYLGMMRNLQRYGWLIPYLFGASPAVSKSFIGNRATDLQVFTTDTLYYPYATSLRMGDIGYQNSLEEGKGFRANYDNLNAYIRSVTWATETSCPHYERLGTMANGEYQQLNTSVLQVENEHYSTIRPKQILEGLEKPGLALQRRGVEYVELRSLDVNIFEPIGIATEQMYFLNVLLLLCLLNDSPRINADEAKAINSNQILAAHRGRELGLKLQRQNTSITLRNWAQELLNAMIPIAETLDSCLPTTPYSDAIAMARERVIKPEATPSARMLREMHTNGEGFAEFSLRLSEKYRANFMAQGPISAEQRNHFEQLARESHERQRTLEAADNVPFEQFLADYFAQSQKTLNAPSSRRYCLS